jgi:hypothetical protein
MGITHSKVSAKSDGGDATLVRPSDWNADHVLTGLVGGMGQTYLGTNNIGGTWTAMTARRIYAKKITLTATSVITSIDVYLRPNTDNVSNLVAGVISDSSGPNLLIGAGGYAPTYLSNSSSMPGAGRWVSLPISTSQAAGDVWIAVMAENGLYDLANDGSSGSNDRYWTSSVFDMMGTYPTAFSVTSTGTPIYSIRASVLQVVPAASTSAALVYAYSNFR